jgi:iron complex outermembrane receptor protein
LLLAGGEPAAGVTVQLGPRRTATTDQAGNFEFTTVPAGNWQLLVSAPGYRPLKLVGLRVQAHRTLTLAPQRLSTASDLMVLEPFVVNAEASSLRTAREAALVARRAAGNIDLPRTANDALPYAIYTRDQIARSGVVNLNQFLQRELLDSDAAAGTAEASTGSSLITTGSANLRLRGFEADETIVFVNGRRMPETLLDDTGSLAAPDVNLVPLGLIEQVEVLPVSAAALYGGNAVGGIINIVLRPDINATEVTTTYTNALGGYDASEFSVSLLHGHSLLDGRLRLRLNATVSRTLPPTETELALLQRRTGNDSAADSLFRATPNIRTADGGPVLAPGGSRFTSVAPGANGTGGLAAFAGRDGLRSLALYDAAGGMASSPVSLDYAYGRRQRRDVLFGSVNYDLFPWLQLGFDLSHSRAVINRGLNVFSQELALPATSAFNPFGRDVIVSLNENTAALGLDYSEARQEATSAIFGVLLKLPAEWRVALDAQYSRNRTRYRGFVGVDAAAWQELVDDGRYQPLRDTQVHAAPAAFYDEVLIYRGGRDEFITLSDYDVLDTALRVTNQSLPLPTGRGTLNAGVDYRRNHLAPFTDLQRYGNGGIVGTPLSWSGRTLQRYSGFAELQGPLAPPNRLPAWLTSLEADIAARYIASDKANEAYAAPTFALKAEFANGLALRGSFTTSSRFPTPRMSTPIALPGGGGGGEGTFIFDPVRNESYVVATAEPLDSGLRTEDAATQTAGVLFQRGRDRRVRLALDFVDTRKTDELFYLSPQGTVNSEALFPQLVQRGPGGRIVSVQTSILNAAWRHSQNWNFAADYAQDNVFGGTLELYARWVHFQGYDRQLLATSPVVDQLAAPDGTISSVLRHRMNFGAGWSRRRAGFGLDGHYFGSRILPVSEWPGQGSDRISASWQFDAYLQGDLQSLLPWRNKRLGLRGQLRVNNVFATGFPRYANDASGAQVQPYGDWRGRTFSLSLTATF